MYAHVRAGSLDMLMSTRSVHAHAHAQINPMSLTKQDVTLTLLESATGLVVKTWKMTATHTESLAQYLLDHHICCVVWQPAQ